MTKKSSDIPGSDSAARAGRGRPDSLEGRAASRAEAERRRQSLAEKMRSRAGGAEPGADEAAD